MAIIRVECPHCGVQFDTGDVGDTRGCWECGEMFQTFTNIVEDGNG